MLTFVLHTVLNRTFWMQQENLERCMFKGQIATCSPALSSVAWFMIFLNSAVQTLAKPIVLMCYLVGCGQICLPGVLWFTHSWQQLLLSKCSLLSSELSSIKVYKYIIVKCFVFKLTFLYFKIDLVHVFLVISKSWTYFGNTWQQLQVMQVISCAIVYDNSKYN